MEPHRCTATARSTGGRCKRRPEPGATVCRAHGGAAPQVRQKAAERVATNEALAELARRGVHSVDNPLAALAELAGEVVAVKDIFRERAARLEEEAWRRTDDKGGEQLRAEIALYERALDRAARVLADIARLRIDERLMAITEAQGQAVAAVFSTVLEQLGLDDKAELARNLVIAEVERLAEAG